MTRTIALITAGWAALTVAALASCSRTPTTPSGAAPFTTRVELIAPGTLAPGATAQLRLIAHQSDGSAQDTTATATFYDRPAFYDRSEGVLAISPGGVVIALKVGESFVIGSERRGSGRSSTPREIVVVPDGTFRVLGQVVEEGTVGLPVGDVRVETDGGVPSASTDFGGHYRLYGVPADARLRVSKNGYVTKELTLAISDHHTENVALALAGPRADVAGVYQLTIDAAPECRGQLPDELLTRRYAAAISQIGAAIQVVVTGANFDSGGITGGSTVIPGRVDQVPGPGGVQRTHVELLLLWPTHCERTEPDSRVVEIIDDTTTLEMLGGASLFSAGANFAGTLTGDIRIFNRPQCHPSSQLRARCQSTSHRVTLTR